MRKKGFKLSVIIMLCFLFSFASIPSEVFAKNGFNQQPTSNDGFNPGKNGQKVKVGSDYGWKDSKNRVWVPDGEMHGGKGWTRQYPNGSHDHVYPGGNIRSHNISGDAGFKKDRINWFVVASLGLLLVVTVFSPIPGDEVVVAGALLGL